MSHWVFPPQGEHHITPHFCWADAVCRTCGRVADLARTRRMADWLERVRESLDGHKLYVLEWHNCAPGILTAHKNSGSHLFVVAAGAWSPEDLYKYLQPHLDSGLLGSLRLFPSCVMISPEKESTAEFWN